MNKVTLLIGLIFLTFFSCQKSEIDDSELNSRYESKENVSYNRTTSNVSWVLLGQLQQFNEKESTTDVNYTSSVNEILNCNSNNLLLNINELEVSEEIQSVFISSDFPEENSSIILVLDERWEVSQIADDGGIIEVVLEQGHDRIVMTKNDGILEIVWEQGHGKVVLDGIEDFIIIETLEED